MTENLHPLELLRLENHWTYRDLARHIHKITGLRRNIDCWRRICLRETTKPNSNTRYALTKFMQSALANGKKGRRVA